MIKISKLFLFFVFIACVQKPVTPRFGTGDKSDDGNHGPMAADVESPENSNEEASTEVSPSSFGSLPTEGQESVAQNPTATSPVVNKPQVVTPAPISPAPVVRAEPMPVPVATTPAPATVVDPTAPLTKEAAAAMIKNGAIFTQYNVTNEKGWGSSPSKRINVYVAVDDKGTAIVPNGIMREQINADEDKSKDAAFATSSGPVKALHSYAKICNRSKTMIYLHSMRGAPFNHGAGPINAGKCASFLIINSDPVVDGASYDHIAGDAKVNWLYYNLKKVKPDGTIY